MAKTKKSTEELGTFGNNDWIKNDALAHSVKLFSDTPFRNLLIGNMRANGSNDVTDVAFYQVTNEIYEFLKTGKFPGYETFKQAEAAKLASNENKA